MKKAIVGLLCGFLGVSTLVWALGSESEVLIGRYLTVLNGVEVGTEEVINSTGDYTGDVLGDVDSDEILGPAPTAEVIASAATITADACGGIKRISSASAVTTGTTNTFTAPAAGNAGCVMAVCNVNASDAITLDANANFISAAAGNVALGANDCITVASDGTDWRQTTALLDN